MLGVVARALNAMGACQRCQCRLHHHCLYWSIALVVEVEAQRVNVHCLLRLHWQRYGPKQGVALALLLLLLLLVLPQLLVQLVPHHWFRLHL